MYGDTFTCGSPHWGKFWLKMLGLNQHQYWNSW